MTAGKLPVRPRAPPRHNETSRAFFDHSSAKRIHTDSVITQSLRHEYPDLHLTTVPVYNNSIVGWASAGHAGIAPVDKEQERLLWSRFVPPPTRLNGGRGVIAQEPKFAKYLVDWKGKEFIVVVVDGRDGTEFYGADYNQYILSPSLESTEQLLLEAGVWNNELHEEIWVYDQGFWQKSAALYDSIRNSSWDDVILDEKKKTSIINDVDTFFDSRDTYEKLRVPWKRGLIYYGPPGNGKTISIKAMMHALYNRKDAIPTLYVKTLTNFFGPEESINEIFSLARTSAPCYLVFEDLDSIVSDNVRSFFLNAVDGIQKNDGILMVGSTNHLERLDPGIAKRPSRFDRKYFFDNPTEPERVQYMRYWQGKLADNDEIEFPDKICTAVAKITKDFSFAYLQEAMVASLLALAREKDGFAGRTCLECMEEHPEAVALGKVACTREAVRVFKGLYDWVWLVRQIEEGDKDLESYILWRELKKQIRILREEMGDEGKAKALCK